MCDQTEVIYLPNDVVWVKLGPVWWPGRVCGEDEIPPEIMKDLRKKPIAIVKFFQEDSFEYVKSLSNIYHYHCAKKNEFIKKGLDLLRSKNSGAPSNMKLFPEDIVRAEHLTHGNPAILQSDMFLPEEKPVYTDIFASAKKAPKKVKSDVKKKPTAVKQNSPRLITHPRFLQLSSGQSTDYEVRERQQIPVRAECDVEDSSPLTLYSCTDCDYTTTRLNVIVWHNKSHTRNYASPQAPAKATKRKSTGSLKPEDSQPKRSAAKPDVDDADKPIAARVPETNITLTVTPSPRKRGRPKGSTSAKKGLAKTAPPHAPKTNSISTGRTPAEKGRRGSVHKGDEIHKSLLEDWLEDDIEQEEPATEESSPAESAERKNKTPANSSVASHDSNGKSCFDFDDSEDHLVIDETKFTPGRKIPRLLKKSAPSTLAADDVVAIQDSVDAVEIDAAADSTPQYQRGVEDSVDGESSLSRGRPSRLQEIGVDNEIEIQTEEAPVDKVIKSVPPKKSRRNLKTEKEANDAAELHDQVDKLLNEISTAPAKLPDMPRAHKKAQLKAYQQQAEAEELAARKIAAEAEAADKAAAETNAAQKAAAEAEAAERVAAEVETAQRAAAEAEAAQRAAAEAEAAQRAAAEAEAAQRAAAEAEAAQKAAAEAEAAQRAAAEAEAAQRAAAEAEAAQRAAAEAEAAQRAAAEAEAAQRAAAEAEAAQRAAAEAEAAQRAAAEAEAAQRAAAEAEAAQRAAAEAEAAQRAAAEAEAAQRAAAEAEAAQRAAAEAEAMQIAAAKAESARIEAELKAAEKTTLEKEVAEKMLAVQQSVEEKETYNFHPETLDIEVSSIPLPSPRKCPTSSDPFESSISIGASVTVMEDKTSDEQLSVISPSKVSGETLVAQNVGIEVSGSNSSAADQKKADVALPSHSPQMRASVVGVVEGGGAPAATDVETPAKLATPCKTTKALNATSLLRSGQPVKLISQSDYEKLLNKWNASVSQVSPNKTSAQSLNTTKTTTGLLCNLTQPLANSPLSGSPKKFLIVTNSKKANIGSTSATTSTASAATATLTVAGRSINLSNATTFRVTPNILQKSAATQKAVAALAKSTGKNIVLDASTFQSLFVTQPQQVCKVQSQIVLPLAAATVKQQAASSAATVEAPSQPGPDSASAADLNGDCANAVGTSSGAGQTVNYIVDSCGNLVQVDEPPTAHVPTKDHDILAKAVENTDGLQTEMTLSEAVTNDMLGSVIQNPETTYKTEVIYENLTLNTPPIMSAYETPSRALATANVLAETANEMALMGSGATENEDQCPT